MDCAPCANRCSRCDMSGAFRCDPGACEPGYYADGFCLPCKVPGCGSCQVSGAASCDSCLKGFYEVLGETLTCERGTGYLCNACHGPLRRRGVGLLPTRPRQAYDLPHGGRPHLRPS